MLLLGCILYFFVRKFKRDQLPRPEYEEIRAQQHVEDEINDSDDDDGNIDNDRLSQE